MPLKSKIIALGESKKMNITSYRDNVYIHFSDMKKQKNFTFNLDEIKMLSKKLPSILVYMKKTQSDISDERLPKKHSKLLEKFSKEDDSEFEDDELPAKKKAKRSRTISSYKNTAESSSEDDY